MPAPLHEHTIPDLDRPLRLDVYAAELPCFASRSAARKACKRGEVHLDGEPAESSRFVQPGQRLSVHPSEATPPRAWAHPLHIPWQDDHLAIVCKPPGVPVSGNHWRTVEQALLQLLPTPALPDALPWAQPAHRLDLRTGGLLLVSRSRRAQVGLGEAFASRQIRKRYVAVLHGRLDGEGEVDAPIEGRTAHSRWEAVAHRPALHTDWLTTVHLWPTTGRTHQLRLHMAGLGHPILGDDRYGPEGKVLRGAGLFLWANRLQLSHPVTGAPIDVEQPPPPRFHTRLDREEARWHKFRA